MSCWCIYVLHKLTCDCQMAWLMEYMFNNVKAQNHLRVLNEIPPLPQRLPVACQRQHTFQMSQLGNSRVSLQEHEKIPRKEAASFSHNPQSLTEVLPDSYLVQRTTRAECNISLTAPVSLQTQPASPRRATCSSCQQNQQTEINHLNSTGANVCWSQGKVTVFICLGIIFDSLVVNII